MQINLFSSLLFDFCFADFSCAFVSDILLQGYLYITKNYIAFYSNVFGYVTKLLIPIKSVTKISKEKTVKIIPNAIAVGTIDERHVFSSFLSREAAYQLMISVWQEALPTSDINLTRSSAQLLACTVGGSASLSNVIPKLNKNSPVLYKTGSDTLQVAHPQRTSSHSGVSEVDDESSSAISGSEGLTHLIQSQKLHLTGEQLSSNPLNANNSSSSSNSNCISKNNPLNCDFLANRDSAFGIDVANRLMDANTVTSTPKVARPLSTAKSTLTDASSISVFQFKIPRSIHIAYFGLSLVIILALMAAFLFYRISEMKMKRNTFSMDDLNTVSKQSKSLFDF